MDGFKRPIRPVDAPAQTPSSSEPYQGPDQPLQPLQPAPAVKPIDVSLAPDNSQPQRSRRIWPFVMLGVIVALIAVIIGGYFWVESQLKPLDPSDKSVQRVEIKDGLSFGFIAQRLEERKLIRSAVAFEVYGRATGKANSLQAGTCQFTAAESGQAILDKLTTGCRDFKSITFFPGATIEQPLYKPVHAQLDQTLNIRNILKKSGYSDADVESALTKQYKSPLFADKPAGTTLEGYVYGETYYVDTNATADQVLKKTFAEMYDSLVENDLINKFKAKGLNLYQGITLASIVQRELNCEGKPTEERKETCYQYQRTIAQIFLKRLDENISLGSDVTFIYAADMMKVTPRVDIDSPYNTRVEQGLPPGPIASPGIHALRSVGDPSDTDYLFFIAGDDGLIYFAKDQAEHEANIKNHCQILCNEL